MVRLLGTLAAGCCCAVLAACAAGGADAATSATKSSSPAVSPPRQAKPWDEEFAAGTILERITVGATTVLVPKGIRLPDGVQLSSATEATVVMADDDPAAVLAAVEASAAGAGYVEYSRSDAVTVWTGHGMAVRLECREGAQLLAWGPEDMKAAFSNLP